MTLRLIPSSVLAFSALAMTSSLSSQAPFLDQQPTQLDSRSAHDTFFATADNFTVSAAVDINSMTWWGSWAVAGAVVPDSFDIYFHQDSAGPFGQQPGTVLASFLGVTPSIAATGLSFPSFAGPLPEYQLDLPLPSTVSLNPGVYWVQIVCTGSSGSGEEFVWEMAPEDLINGAPCMAWSLDTPGLTWFSCTPFGETDMSLQLFESSGPSYSATGLVGGGTAVFDVSSATPFGTVFLGYSVTGPGPTPTAFGVVAMSPPIQLLQALAMDVSGAGTWSTLVPPSASGLTLYTQAVDITGGSLSNPLAVTIL